MPAPTRSLGQLHPRTAFPNMTTRYPAGERARMLLRNTTARHRTGANTRSMRARSWAHTSGRC